MYIQWHIIMSPMFARTGCKHTNLAGLSMCRCADAAASCSAAALLASICSLVGAWVSRPLAALHLCRLPSATQLPAPVPSVHPRALMMLMAAMSARALASSDSARDRALCVIGRNV